MKCPSCSAATLVHDTRDLPYTYKGESTILPQVTGDFCSACDESILDAAESRVVDAGHPAHDESDAGLQQADQCVDC